MSMKALKEIGIAKAARFGVLTLLMVLYRVLIVPQLRVPFLCLLGAHIGKNVIIHPVSFFNHYRCGFSGLKVGDNCFLGNECLVDLAGTVILENDVTLAERVTVLTHRNVGYKNHPLQEEFPPETKGIIIRAGSFIGANAVILPGTEIGENVFVAAGSVVTRNVPSHTMVAGVPAGKIRDLSTKPSKR